MTMNVLSLGAGVQSTALLLLAAEGRIQKPEVAVFADTGWEPRAVYEHLDKLERDVATPAGIEVRRVKATTQRGIGIREHLVAEDTRYFRIPTFMRRLVDRDGVPVGDSERLQIMQRSCTQTYKIEPIHREYRRLLGSAVSATGRVSGVPKGGHVVQQIGISLDEIQRAKDSRQKWITNSYPLLDLGWSRTDCIQYLTREGWGATEKSACIGCPFHSNTEWTRIRDTKPDEWLDVVAVDAAIRNGPPRERVDGTRWSDTGTTFFLHSSGKPLAEAIDTGQMNLFDGFEQGFSCSPHTCRGDDDDFTDAIRAGGISIAEDDE